MIFSNIVKTKNYYTDLFGIPTQKRPSLSAPYQMSKVKSTLHQLVRDWSDEVSNVSVMYSRVEKSVSSATDLYCKLLKSMFPLFVKQTEVFLQPISNSVSR